MIVEFDASSVWTMHSRLLSLLGIQAHSILSQLVLVSDIGAQDGCLGQVPIVSEFKELI